MEKEIEIGDTIAYMALGGKTQGTVKDKMDDVLLVHVSPSSWILVNKSQVLSK